MYELLIVDDETHIANGIKASMDWNLFGISTVHVAYSAKQAREIFGQSPIDIVICDIEMPEEDGFVLLTWIKAHYPTTEVIFLTCHAEFRYAQKAIQLGSMDYILKPVPNHVLESLMTKVIDKILNDRKLTEFTETYKHYANLWSAHQPLLIERFWWDLLNYNISPNLERIMERVTALNIPIRENAQFIPILISVQRWQKTLTVREEQIMEYALRKAAEETLLVNGRQGQVLSINQGKLLAIIALDDPDHDMGRFRKECESYIAACNQYLYCHLSCYIGKYVFVQDMNEIYQNLIQMDKQNVTCHNWVFQCEDNQVHTLTDLNVQHNHMSLWSELLKHGNKEQVVNDALKVLESWQGVEGLDYKVLQIFYQDFLQMVHHILKQKEVLSYQVLSEQISPERSLVATRSVIDLQDWVNEIVDKVFEYMQSMDKNLKVVDKIKHYVSQNIDRDFSRQDLADHVQLSPDHVVKLFKKETGTLISNYILQERMNKASALLVRSNIPISEISLIVGYSNFSYFSKVFKSVTSLNPQEYRKQHQII